MPLELRLLAYAAILTWVMILTAAQLRAGRGLQSLRFGLSNRDEAPPLSPMAARAERAAKNMLENMVLFTAVTVACLGARDHHARIELGARLFFWARLAYFPVYVAGITHVRSLLWAVSVAGMGLMVSAVL